ncbi:hypothetical protein HPP92_000537 [Vanilla planifolia]|uniref:Uncharacterized protein n=1 Tax=Vanilla planifolia TaxID=51239 RepID=A0A835RXN2_VANPL|nr:hypothetical protein HPP92_000537 [Vanilla planifolia]
MLEATLPVCTSASSPSTPRAHRSPPPQKPAIIALKVAASGFTPFPSSPPLLQLPPFLPAREERADQSSVDSGIETQIGVHCHLVLNLIARSTSPLLRERLVPSAKQNRGRETRVPNGDVRRDLPAFRRTVRTHHGATREVHEHV